jgi:hypothetical protein
MGRVTPSDASAGSFLYARALQKEAAEASLRVTILNWRMPAWP